eukprot:scaffold12387_cov63-Cyclotella_meneghiniana.AAC.5
MEEPSAAIGLTPLSLCNINININHHAGTKGLENVGMKICEIWAPTLSKIKTVPVVGKNPVWEK